MTDADSVARTFELDCYKTGCDWSQTFTDLPGEIAAKVDAELHWVRDHEGLIPEGACYGDQQCPNCHDVNGLNGTVSCSTCGHIPDTVRA